MSKVVDGFLAALGVACAYVMAPVLMYLLYRLLALVADVRRRWRRRRNYP